MVAETPHLLEEALRSGCEIGAVLAADPMLGRVERLLSKRPDVRLIALPTALSGSLSATETSQGVLTLVRRPSASLSDLFSGVPLVVALDGVQDPGNVGAIVRAAEAFGATGAAFFKGSANPYNPKAIRASAGSIFRLPVATGCHPAAFLSTSGGRGVVTYAALPAHGIEARSLDLARACAIVIGGEGRGLSAERWAGAVPVRIPTRSVESLNAAMAAGILLYEARRQRERA
ncbi:MAG: RNA methyltransferase [Bryobacterales bacterium]|nr:RNA methyltransferase [Bryobacterales bacterium]